MRNSGWLAILGSVCCATTAVAHHSGAMFDHTKMVKVEGTVKSWEWANPHSWLTLDTPDGKGGTIAQSFETGSPNTMYRNGWRQTTFKPGDRVSIVAYPRNDAPVNGMMISAVTAGGQALTWLPAGATASAKLVTR